jgi:hypothetical protein
MNERLVFLPVSVVGVVDPLAGGVFPSTGSSALYATLGVLEPFSTGDSARGDSKPVIDNSGELKDRVALKKDETTFSTSFDC